MSNRGRNAFVVLCILLAGVFGLGVLLGRMTVLRPVDASLAYWDPARSVGRLADARNQRSFLAQAYLDPERALREMDEYPWVLPQAPTPFFGAVTAPTEQDRVTIWRPGFRGPHDPQASPPNLKTVVLLGGSTAFSVGAPSDATTIGGQLEAALGEGFRVLTFASPSWTTNQERLATEHVLRSLSVDAVVSLSGVNDVVFGQLGHDPDLLRTHYEKTFSDLLQLLFAEVERPHGPDPVPAPGAPRPFEQVWSRLRTNLEVMSFLLDGRDVPLVYALQPTLYAASHRTPSEDALLSAQPQDKRAYFETHYPQLARRLTQLKLPSFSFVDLSDPFLEEPREMVFIDAYHFGDRGNRALGRRLAEAVRAAITSTSSARSGTPG